MRCTMDEGLPGTFPADRAGYAVFSSPQSIIFNVCSVKGGYIGLPLMLLPSCWTDVPPPDLPPAVDAHLLRADLHIPIKVPELQHTTRLLCYGVTGAHTAARTERTPCSLQAAAVHAGLPDMLMRAIGWPVLSFSAPPPELPLAARSEPFKEVQTPRAREKLGIDLWELILHLPTRILESAKCYNPTF